MPSKTSFASEFKERIKSHKVNSLDSLFFNSILDITDELSHSNIISWILSLNDAVNSNYRLLNSFLYHIDENHFKINQPPNRIIKEQVTASGRKADIVVEWDDFILIIENKTKTKELSGQCEAYLDNAKAKGKKAHLIFLTKVGSSPKSLDRNPDLEITLMSYTELVIYLNEVYKEIDKNIKLEDDSKKLLRHKIIIKDYILSLQYLIRRGVITMDSKVKDLNEDSLWLWKNYQGGYTALWDIAQKDTDTTLIRIDELIKELYKRKYSDSFEIDSNMSYRGTLIYKKNWIIHLKNIKDDSKNKARFGYIYEGGQGSGDTQKQKDLQIFGERHPPRIGFRIAEDVKEKGPYSEYKKIVKILRSKLNKRSDVEKPVTDPESGVWILHSSIDLIGYLKKKSKEDNHIQDAKNVDNWIQKVTEDLERMIDSSIDIIDKTIKEDPDIQEILYTE